MRMWLARAGGTAVGLGVWLALLPAAWADEPFAVTDPITDRVGALGGREAEVEEAQDRLFEDHHLDLFVVYVESFAGLGAEEWAAEAAEQSTLDINQALLVVSTENRDHHLLVDPEYPLEADSLADIQTIGIDPALAEYDWAGAAIGASEGLRATLRGESVSEPVVVPGDPEPAAGGDVPWVLIVLAAAVVVGLGVLGYVWMRRRDEGQAVEANGLIGEAEVGNAADGTDDAVAGQGAQPSEGEPPRSEA